MMTRTVVFALALTGCFGEPGDAGSESNECSVARAQVIEDCAPMWDVRVSCMDNLDEGENENECDDELEDFNSCVYPDDNETSPEIISARRIAYWCDLFVDDNGNIMDDTCLEQQAYAAQNGVETCDLP